MIVELIIAGFVLMVSAEQEQPAATVAVTYQGKVVPLGAKAAAQLRGDLEELLSGCSLASPATAEEGRLDLEVQLTYARPRTLATIVRGHPQVQLTQIRLAASPGANEGWPLVYGTGPAMSRQFYKCNGGKILDTVCTAELEGFVPPKVRDSCSLAPRRRASKRGQVLNLENSDGKENVTRSLGEA